MQDGKPTNGVWRMAIGVLCVAALASSAASQDPFKLFPQMQAEMNASRYADAEKTARAGLAAAERDGNSHLIRAYVESVGYACELQGHYADAEQQYRRMVKLEEQAEGVNDPLVGSALSNLGDVVKKQARYAEAERLYRRALKILEEHGGQQSSIAGVLNNLAGLYADLDRRAEAIPLYERSLKIKEKVRGPDHEDVALALYNLANTYNAQARYAEAERTSRRALAIYEKVRGKEHPDVADCLNQLANLCSTQGRLKESEQLHLRALAIREKLLAADHPALAFSLNNLALLYADQGRYIEAEPMQRRALAILEKIHGRDHPDVATALNGLAGLCADQGHYAEAERCYRRSLAIREAAFGSKHRDVASSLNNLANLLGDQARFAEMEPLYQRSLEIREVLLGPEHPDVASSLNNLAKLYLDQSRFDDAEPLYVRSLAIRKKVHGESHPDVAVGLAGLAHLARDRGQYAEAERLYRQALAIREQALGAEHPDVAESLGDLAGLLRDIGRIAEAESFYRRALAIRVRVQGAAHPQVASDMNDLANLCVDQTRYAEAESYYRRALAIWQGTLGPEHPEVATAEGNLGGLFRDEGRTAEAAPLLERSLAIREKAFGPDDSPVAGALNSLANLYADLGRNAEAEQFYQRALAIQEKLFGPEHPAVAVSLHNLAILRRDQKKFAEAEALYDRARAIDQKVLGPEHPGMAQDWYNLANLRLDQERPAEAEDLLGRSFDILERLQVRSDLRLNCRRTRAQLRWKAGRRTEAVADMRSAMDLADGFRGDISGTEEERARSFSHFSSSFQQMAAWQIELGDHSEALRAAERLRTRELRDQLELQGADLLAGVPADEAAELRRRERDAQVRIASLQRQFDLLPSPSEASPDEKTRAEALVADVRSAQEELAAAYAEIRNASPVLRLAASKNSASISLPELQSLVAFDDALLLYYLFGEEHGNVLIVSAKSSGWQELQVTAELAADLKTSPGPLTAGKLAEVFGAAVRGKTLLEQLADPGSGGAAGDRLAALWQTLVPEAERKALTTGKYKRLVVVPDGPLALLPFETLVVGEGRESRVEGRGQQIGADGEDATRGTGGRTTVVAPDDAELIDPTYLLDVGPPILYAPSATVLHSLSQRAAAKSAGGREPVLSVGNPSYGKPAAQVAANSGGALDALKPRSRYSGLGGELTELPHSAWETAWVSEVFGKRGQKVLALSKGNATEANVRQNLSGRKIVHLACHGLADRSYGNLFGALALTPGTKSAVDPADDGFLTLAEIYGLNLSGCELAILSACETNYGPTQQGEGVWALSRGFLVAGARRVVASNWRVDDKATAHLVSYFAANLAKAHERGETPDYALALQEAKRSLRKQAQWQSPYYWGSFVLVGPR